MAMFSEISINLQLALGQKTVDGLLEEAIQDDNPGALGVLIKKQGVSERLGPLLVMALKKSRVKAFKFLAGAVGEERFHQAATQDGYLPLLIARSGSIELANALMELKFDLNAPSPEGKTLAFMALEEGKLELFKYLVEALRKQDEVAVRTGKRSPGDNSLDAVFKDVPQLMAQAIKDQRIDQVKLLLSHDASPNPKMEDLASLGRIERMRRQKEGKKSFVQMAIEVQSAAIIEILADGGADLSPPGTCLLEVAMSFPDMSVVKLLARKMGNDAVNAARDSYGNSMLNKAVVDSNLPIAEFFMGIPGVDLNQFNFKGLTPICEAANNRRMDIAELLLKNGVNINTPVNPESRNTLLHNAVMTSNDGLARWAMERKIDHNARDSRGQTALDVAVATKNIPMIELLVDSDNTDINSGCYKAVTAQDRTASTQYRRPPLQLAVVQMLESPKLPDMNQMTDVVALLIDLGANVNAQDSNGTTALHLLAQELDRIKAQFGARAERAPNVRRILKMMVKAGVDPNIADFSGKRPVDVARQGAGELKLLFDSGDFEILPPEQHAQGESNIAGRPMPDAPPLDSPLPTQSQVRARNTRMRFDDSQVPPGQKAGQ